MMPRFKTFRQKVLVLPAVAAVFLVAILAVSVLLGRATTRVHERIGMGLAPALEQSRAMQARFTTLQQEVGALAQGLAPDRLAAVRLLARDLDDALAAQAKNPVVEGQRVVSQRAALAAYWRGAGEAAERGAQGAFPAAHSALTEAQAPATALSELLQRGIQQDGQALQAAFAEVTSLHATSQGAIILLVVLCMAALGGLSLWLAREVVGPLVQLTETLRRITSEGDLTREIEVRSDDEVGQLARSIQELVKRLRLVPLSLNKLVGELTQTATQLTRANQEHLEFLTLQSRSLTEAGATMSQIAQTSEVASSRADMVMKVAAQADAFGASGQKSIEESAQGLQLIRERVGTLVGSISRLAEQAVHAGEVVGSVKDLADQSNVLALNAAIEAARAGDEGLGFAVVAREMRTLSAESLKSTQRIGRILFDIDKAIRQAVAMAAEDSQQMEQNLEQVLASATTLKEITTVVQESSHAARQIVASVTQQNAGIGQMTEVITQLSVMMGDVGNATMQAQEAVAQLNTSVAELQAVVAHFRV
jgi:methyl-accepting chemotaxis protein